MIESATSVVALNGHTGCTLLRSALEGRAEIARKGRRFQRHGPICCMYLERPTRGRQAEQVQLDSARHQSSSKDGVWVTKQRRRSCRSELSQARKSIIQRDDTDTQRHEFGIGKIRDRDSLGFERRIRAAPTPEELGRDGLLRFLTLLLSGVGIKLVGEFCERRSFHGRRAR